MAAGVLRGPQGRMWSKTHGNYDWPRVPGPCQGAGGSASPSHPLPVLSLDSAWPQQRLWRALPGPACRLRLLVYLLRRF